MRFIVSFATNNNTIITLKTSKQLDCLFSTFYYIFVDFKTKVSTGIKNTVKISSYVT